LISKRFAENFMPVKTPYKKINRNRNGEEKPQDELSVMSYK
jgi:hypothetical protein